MVEHFAFGWQALEILNFPCRLEDHGLSTADEATLMRGMPQMRRESIPCADGRDAGPSADVSTLRLQMRGPLIPRVGVAGSFAKGDWYGGGGGETYFQKTNGTWHVIAGGGGLHDSSEVRKLGVPASALCVLEVHGAGCSSH